MDCVLAIDQGTQSTRVFVYDKQARPVASHQEEFAQIYPRQGYGNVLRNVAPTAGAANPALTVTLVQVVRA